MAGSVTVGGVLTGTLAGTQYIGPYTLNPTTTGNFAVTEVTLVSGANTISVPSWATVVLIIPPVTNTIALTQKGVSGDTGTAISPQAVSVLSFPSSPPASFVVNAATTTTGVSTFIFS